MHNTFHKYVTAYNGSKMFSKPVHCIPHYEDTLTSSGNNGSASEYICDLCNHFNLLRIFTQVLWEHVSMSWSKKWSQKIPIATLWLCPVGLASFPKQDKRSFLINTLAELHTHSSDH